MTDRWLLKHLHSWKIFRNKKFDHSEFARFNEAAERIISGFLWKWCLWIKMRKNYFLLNLWKVKKFIVCHAKLGFICRRRIILILAIVLFAVIAKKINIKKTTMQAHRGFLYPHLPGIIGKQLSGMPLKMQWGVNGVWEGFTVELNKKKRA